MLRQKTGLGIGLVVLFVPAVAGFSRVARAAQLSPPATAMCQFTDGKTITIEYSSPRVRERKIFGGLVPYGRVWILGANEATSFVPTTGVTIGGKNVPAGRYSALVTLTQSGTTTAADGLVERVLYQVDSVTGLTGAAAIVGVPAPRSSFFFAEGFTTPGPNPRFSERYILSNPCPTSDCVGAATAHATLTFQRTDGSTLSTPVTLTPGQQQIVDAASVLGAGTVSNSASVTSDQPILAERFMSFHFAPAALGGNAAVGATEAIGAAAPHNLFYFAEGTTLAGFAEFLTIQNPDPTQTATVTVTLLPTTGAPVVKVLTVGPHSRFTLDVNSVLGGQSLSLVVESNVAIVAERPLYFDFRGTLPGGTDVVGYQP